MTGTIARVIIEKGFGFLRGEDNVERFFHRSEVLGTFEMLREGMAVTFEEDRAGGKGPRAKQVQAVGD
jgi:cold shock CspA family protein